MLEDIPYGKYTIKETEAPSGFRLSEDVLECEITEHGQVIELTMKNTEIPDLPGTGVPADSPIVPVIVMSALLLFVAVWFILNRKNRKRDD